MKKAVWLSFVLLLFVMGVVTASEVTTDRLNFFGSEQHTVTITNTLGVSGNATLTMPTGFSFVSSVSGCTNPSGQTITCNSIPDDGNASFIMSSTGSGTEYTLYTLTTTLNGNPLNDVDFINIANDEIFHTLVEYGRGRGNYFYNSMGSSTSAGTGTGYNYVPNSTDFELNYLHKVYNIKQYFGLATSRATDVTFSCVYPYHTVVRQHLTTSITNDANDWTVAYSLPRIDGSWERMGFLGMDIDAGEYDVGNTFLVNCTNLAYTLEDAYGNIVVEEDSFEMEIRSPNPLSVSASSDTAQIGNGTSEVLVTYTITNNEVYPLDSVQIEIEAPENAEFIGVRGELWGTAKDKYVYELTEMRPSQVETISLVARFDTSSGSDTSLLLSEGIKVKFVPTWELNAYNPLTTIQDLSVTQTQTVNYAVTSEITSIREQLNQIEANTISINTTINSFYTLLQEINATTSTTSSNLLSINSSLSTQISNGFTNLSSELDNLESDLSSLTIQVTNFENTVQQLVNCTANPTAPLCYKLDNLNLTITNIQNDLLSINSSLSTQIYDVNQSIMSELSSQFTNVANNFTYTNNLILSINQSINDNIDSLNFTALQSEISNMSSLVVSLNGTVTNMYADLLSINTTINNQLSGFNNRFDEIITELSYMQSFNEELIFLVTDSVGLATESRSALNNGDTGEAILKLEEATAKLEQASELIEDEKAKTQNLYDQKTSKGFKKLIFVVKGWFI